MLKNSLNSPEAAAGNDSSLLRLRGGNRSVIRRTGQCGVAATRGINGNQDQRSCKNRKKYNKFGHYILHLAAVAESRLLQVIESPVPRKLQDARDRCLAAHNFALRQGSQLYIAGQIIKTRC